MDLAGRLSYGVRLVSILNINGKLETGRDWQVAFAITAALRVIYSAVAAAAALFLHPDPLCMEVALDKTIRREWFSILFTRG